MSNTSSTESEKIDELDPSGSSPEETEKEDHSDTKINLEERAARRLALLALTDSNQYECDSSGTWIDQSGSQLLPVSPSSLPLLATLHRELRKGLESNSDSGPKISNKPSSFPFLQHCNFFLSKPIKPDTESAKTEEYTSGDKIVTVLEPSECHSAQSWPQFPAFSGDSSDWLAFKSAYLDIKTESKTDLLEILKEALTDKAKECVSEMLLANAEPDNIMAVLEQRFGSESLIVKQMENLQALPQASMQNLCQFTAKVNSCLVNIKTLLGNEPLYNTEIYGTIVKKLDAELLNRWFEYVDTVDNDKLPIVVSLNEFLVQQAYALRYLAAAAVSKQSSMPRGTGDCNVTSRSGQCGGTDSMSALYQSCFNVTIELGIELSRQLDLWLSKADLTHGPARAIIAPHAGYSYSGACAAFAYRQISPVVVKRIFILGPSHHVRLGGCALSSLDKYETPLYPLTIDKQIYSELEATRQFEWMDVQTDEDEHSIEMHLPYIAKVMEEYKTGFTIIPILVGSLTPEKEAKYGAILAPYLADPQNLVVVSSDFCHWGQRFRYTWRDSSKTPIYQSIEWLDKQGMDIIEKMDPRAFTEYLNKYGNTICGRHPIGVLMQAVTKLQSSSEAPRMSLKFLKYAQSSQCMNMSDSSVSYASASLVFE